MKKQQICTQIFKFFYKSIFNIKKKTSIDMSTYAEKSHRFLFVKDWYNIIMIYYYKIFGKKDLNL